MTDPTPAQLTALLALHEAATPGAWHSRPRYEDHAVDAVVDGGAAISRVAECGGRKSKEDARFIVAAHAAVPALCRSLTEAWAELAKERAEHKAHCDDRNRRLDDHSPAHDYRPIAVAVGERQAWRCSYCGHATEAPVRPSLAPCPNGPSPCLPRTESMVGRASLAAAQAEVARLREALEESAHKLKSAGPRHSVVNDIKRALAGERGK